MTPIDQAIALYSASSTAHARAMLRVLRAAKRDKARLDFLEREGAAGYRWFCCGGDIDQVASEQTRSTGKTPRAAIDAAMRAGKENKQP